MLIITVATILQELYHCGSERIHLTITIGVLIVFHTDDNINCLDDTVGEILLLIKGANRNPGSRHVIELLADHVAQLIQLLTSELDGDQIGGFGGVHRCCFELELIIQTPVPCTRPTMPPLRLSTVVSSCDSPELLITTVCVLSVHHQR